MTKSTRKGLMAAKGACLFVGVSSVPEATKSAAFLFRHTAMPYSEVVTISILNGAISGLVTAGMGAFGAVAGMLCAKIVNTISQNNFWRSLHNATNYDDVDGFVRRAANHLSLSQKRSLNYGAIGGCTGVAMGLLMAQAVITNELTDIGQQYSDQPKLEKPIRSQAVATLIIRPKAARL